jgi:hypothetical protein
VSEQAWSFFLLRNIDRRLLARLQRDARREHRSLSDFIRSLLCAHFSLDCPPSEAQTRLEFGAQTQLLRLHPELFMAIKEEHLESGESMRSIVMEILETRYRKEAAA